MVGSGNSAHDICADLWEHGADVTMIQRSSTHVAKSDSLMELALSGLYSESAVKSGITTDTADLIFASVPYKIMHTFHIPVYKAIAERDAEFLQHAIPRPGRARIEDPAELPSQRFEVGRPHGPARGCSPGRSGADPLACPHPLRLPHRRD